jgi:hypothetical protein
MREWVILPTLRLPLRAYQWDGDSLKVTAAPVLDSRIPSGWSMSRTIMELDEAHLLQAARLYRRNDELRRVVFNDNYAAAGGNFQEDILARNIVGLQFIYHPAERLLTMYIAARGTERLTSRQPLDWPSWLPEQISAADSRYRIVVKALTWRIRN